MSYYSEAGYHRVSFHKKYMTWERVHTIDQFIRTHLIDGDWVELTEGEEYAFYFIDESAAMLFALEFA